MHGILLRAMEDETPLEMIYISNDGSLSQRWIKVTDMLDDRIKAYCFLRRKYRVFKLWNILSVSPMRKKNFGA